MIPLPITVVLLVGAVIAAFAFHLHVAVGLLIGFAFLNEFFRAATVFAQKHPDGVATMPTVHDSGVPAYTENAQRPVDE